MALRAELVSLTGLSAGDVERWRQLAAEAAEPNPFFEPLSVLPATAALGTTDVSLLIARDGEGAPWLGCLPVQPSRRWRGVPLPAIASWTHLYCFLGTPLLAWGREQEALEAMLPAALADGPWSYLGLSKLGTGGRVAEALEATSADAGLSVIPYEQAERAGLRRRANPAGYIAANRKHQRGHERQRRRLAEALGGEAETVDRAGEEDAIERFLELEASGWKGREGTAFASIGGHADFFREICRGFAGEGRLQLLSFECGNRVLASTCNLRAGSTIFNFKIAFDEEFARFSPGIQIELDNTRIFHHESGAEVLDSCAVPGNEMINKLWADRIPIQAVAVAARGRAALLRPIVRGLGSIRARVRG